MTLRYILVILSFTFSATVQAQLYRVFFQEKGEDLPIDPDHLHKVGSYCDSVWMHSNWLNYALVENSSEPVTLLKFEFVDHIEKVESLQSIPLQVSEKKDSADAELLHAHLQWQLDTMGFQFFHRNKINGAGITIAIIDAGFDKANESRAFQHIYAANRVLKTYDFIDNDSNVYHGSSHGTSVWSLIGGNLDGQPIGLAPNASFILLRSEDQQTETMADEDRWILAIEKAYEWGADIVNSSIGFSNVLHKRSDLNGQTLISKAADMAAKKGMLVVISAGNEWVTAWRTLAVPADADGVISVGGIDKEGGHSYFSSVGPTADGRAKPEVVAPGTCVAVKGNQLHLGNGTSYAAPLVAGYLACMLEWKGKGNFTKDSLQNYAGLYPYFDYMYGYGVPYAPIKTVASEKGQVKCHAPIVDKTKKTISNSGVVTSLNAKNSEWMFVKIVGTDGQIKFSKRFKLKGKKVYTVPSTAQKPFFNYSRYYNPQPDDQWQIWMNYCYYQY
jgi:serine protease AprX